MAVNTTKLRLTLARIEAKLANNKPLSVPEESLLAELNRRRFSKPKQTITETPDAVHVVKTHDVDPLMQAMKDYADVLDKHKTGVAGAKMIGSIDTVIADNWVKETGIKFGTKEFAKFASSRLKNDIDYRGFRLGG